MLRENKAPSLAAMGTFENETLRLRWQMVSSSSILSALPATSEYVVLAFLDKGETVRTTEAA